MVDNTDKRATQTTKTTKHADKQTHAEDDLFVIDRPEPLETHHILIQRAHLLHRPIRLQYSGMCISEDGRAGVRVRLRVRMRVRVRVSVRLSVRVRSSSPRLPTLTLSVTRTLNLSLNLPLTLSASLSLTRW